MKSVINQFAVAALAIVSLTVTTPNAIATDLTLDGSGYYDLSDVVDYYSGRGKKQSGKYKYLGADYYHRAETGMDFLSNNSNSRSGTMSFEFWALDFYGADTGTILMTHRVSPLPGRDGYEDFYKEGYAISLNDYYYPELSLWEFTRKGWKFRDALSFSSDSLL